MDVAFIYDELHHGFLHNPSSPRLPAANKPELQETHTTLSRHDMPLHFECPNCQGKLSAPDQFAGRKAKCKKCGVSVVVPSEARSSLTKPTPSLDVSKTLPLQPSQRTVSKQAILEAIHSPIVPVPSTLTYQAALIGVAIVMLLLPLLYFGLILGLGWGTWLYAQYGFEVLKNNPPQGRRGGGAVLLYVGPVVASGVAILFMVKPFLARPAKGSKPRSLDPKAEPLLFAYVEKICKSVHAPVPKRIDIDANVNAAASLRHGWLSLFRRNDLVLTIGMPLASGLTLREFSGVLAHEFGHFSQGLGMRLSYVVRNINFWFARIVYERDAWDQRLASWASAIDFRIGLILHFARLMVWLTRCILWVFMMIGNAISCLLMRQMEFDADLHEIRLSGSNAFASTSRQLRRLGLAHQQTLNELQEFFLDGKLVDDIPKLVELRRDSQEKSILDLIATMEKEEKGHWYDTHPVDRSRIQAAEKLELGGKIRLEAPARLLFDQYEEHCKNVTRDFYQESFGEQFNERMLAGVDQLQSFQEAAKDASRASDRFFGLHFKLPRMLMPVVWSDRGTTEKESVERLQVCRKAMIDGLQQYDQNSLQFDTLDTQWIEAKQAMTVMRAGFQLDKKAWSNLTSHTPEAFAQLEHSLRSQLGLLHGQLATMEEHFRNRVDAAIQWLHATSPEHRVSITEELLALAERVLKCLSGQSPAYRHVVDLRGEFSSSVALLGLIAGKNATQEQFAEVEQLCRRVYESVKVVRENTVGIPYPFEHSEGNIDLSHYLVRELPKPDDSPAILESAAQLLKHFHYAYFRCVGSLAMIVENVETALGWPLQADPIAAKPDQPAKPDQLVSNQESQPLPHPLTLPNLTTPQPTLPSDAIPVQTAYAIESDPYPSPASDNGMQPEAKTNKWIWIAAIGCLTPATLAAIASILAVPYVFSLLDKSNKPFGSSASQGNAPRNFPVGSSAVALQPNASAISQDRNHAIQRKFQYRIPTEPWTEHYIVISDAAGSGQNYIEGFCRLKNLNQSEVSADSEGTGTGFAISSDGLIATSAHVVATASLIQVIVNQDRANARIVAIDWEKDLAILKVDSVALRPLPLSKSRETALAQDVMVVGYPLTDELGTGVKVTTGTVSGIVNRGARGDMISLDASVNPGNSGGPVINQYGEVIGVTSMKLSSGGGVESVGFASPANQLQDLINYSKLKLNGPGKVSQSTKSRPALAAEVTPSVVLIYSKGRRDGSSDKISFQLNYKQSGGLFASTGNVNTKGILQVTPYGQILSRDNGPMLPFVLGTLPQLLFEQMESTSQTEWTTKRIMTLQKVQSRLEILPRFPKMNSQQPSREIVESIPAIEEISYKLTKEENGKLFFDRKFSFKTIDDESKPTIKMEGDGVWQFDLNSGLSHSLDQKLVIREKGSETHSIRVQYDRRTEAEIAQAKASQDSEMAAQKERERIEREVPDPVRVGKLLDDLKKAGFGGQSWQILGKISEVAVVEELRPAMLALLRQYAIPENKKNAFMGRSQPKSVKAFCHWADESSEKDVLLIAKGMDSSEEKSSVIAYLGRLKKIEHLDRLLSFASDPFVNDDVVKAVLQFDDPSIEDTLIAKLEKTRNSEMTEAISKLLGEKFGTQKCIPLLQEALDQSPFSRFQVDEALRKIKARNKSK